MKTPDRLPINTQKWIKLPIIGWQTVDMKNLDKNYVNDQEGYVINANYIRKEKE